MSKIAKAFGRRLQALRRSRRLSQEQLAERANLCQNAVGSFERGVRFPRSKSLEALLSALELGAEDGITALLTASEEFPDYLSQLPVSPARRELLGLLADEPEDVVSLVADLTRRILEHRRASR